MRLSRPSPERTPRPRPIHAADVLLDTKDEHDSGVEFDPKRDLRPTDWEGMKRVLEGYRDMRDWWNFSDSAVYLSLLFPDRTSELGLAEAFAGMKERLERDRSTKRWEDFSNLAMRLSLLFPDCKAELDLDEAFEGMRERLGVCRGKNWWYFSNLAMRLSLLFPDRKEELKLDHEAFTGMRGELEKNRGKDWWTFSDIAKNLTILAADSAQITSDGRILIVPKRPRLSPDPKPLPKQSRL